jgi:hypothetical protein
MAAAASKASEVVGLMDILLVADDPSGASAGRRLAHGAAIASEFALHAPFIAE